MCYVNHDISTPQTHQDQLGTFGSLLDDHPLLHFTRTAS